MWSRRASSLALVLFAPSLALAQPADESTADELFREGRAALEANDTPTACEKLARSHELDPATGTLILLAFCHEKQGKFATAHREYLEAVKLAEASGDAERAKAARRFAENVRSKRHVLVIVAEGGRAPITLDGEPLPRGLEKHEVALDPGSYVVAAGAGFQRAVKIPSSAGRTILNVPAPAAPAPRSAASEPTSFWSDNALAVAAIGVGIVGVGVGSYFGLRAFSKNDDSDAFCDADERCQPEGRELREDAQRAATVSNVAFAVGFVGIGTGTVLLLANGSPNGRSATIGVAGRF